MYRLSLLFSWVFYTSTVVDIQNQLEARILNADFFLMGRPSPT